MIFRNIHAGLVLHRRKHWNSVYCLAEIVNFAIIRHKLIPRPNLDEGSLLDDVSLFTFEIYYQCSERIVEMMLQIFMSFHANNINEFHLNDFFLN